MEPEDIWDYEYEFQRGAPTGPLKWVHQFACYVREFTDPRTDLIARSAASKETLQYHVPQDCRGPYKPDDLPDGYLPSVTWDIEHHSGNVLCTSWTKAGKKCRKLAVNRSANCEAHGGSLHPLDKVEYDDKNRSIQGNRFVNERLGRTGDSIVPMNRWDQLKQGIITVEDLDDEELSRGQCRDIRGGFSGIPPRMVPRELHDAMMAQLSARAKEKFKRGLLGAVDALVEIAHGNAYEPADRIKAATLVIDRVMGKTPDVIIAAGEKPAWEQIFETITRDTNGDAAYARIESAIDAEVVEGWDEQEPVGAKSFGPEPNPGQIQEPIGVLQDPDPREPMIPYYPLPPHHGDLRNQFEASGGINPTEHTKVAESRETLEDRIKAGRAKRYAARAVGLSDLSNLPYRMDLTEVTPGTVEFSAVYRVQFIAPDQTKVPRQQLAKEGRQRSYERNRG